MSGFRVLPALEFAGRGLVDFGHELGGEFEGHEERSGFRALDAALAGCVNDLGDGDEDCAFIGEWREHEGFVLARMTFLAAREGVGAFGWHGVLLVGSDQ